MSDEEIVAVLISVLKIVKGKPLSFMLVDDEDDPIIIFTTERELVRDWRTVGAVTEWALANGNKRVEAHIERAINLNSKTLSGSLPRKIIEYIVADHTVANIETRKFDIRERIGHQNPCNKCYGLGTKMYGSTATWTGGIGGAAMTLGPCDTCWGSGLKRQPWPSHRTFMDMKRYYEKTPKDPENNT